MSVVPFDRQRQNPAASSRNELSKDAAYDRDLLARLISMFETSEDASRKSRSKAERDVDYYDGKQLTVTEFNTIKKRGQAPHVDNRVKRKIRYLEGLEQQQRTDPRALPRTPQHEEDATAVTDCLRYVTESNNWNQLRSRVWKDLLCWGWSGYEIVLEENPTRSNPKIIIRRCQADRMFWDPFSEAEDFEDARYLGLCVWGDKDEFIARYGGDARKVFDETVAMGDVGNTYDDKPKHTTWVSYDKRYRVRIIQIYYRTNEGQWHFCEFTRGGFLAGGVSPWVDEYGAPEHPYSWGSANVDRDNNRYGEIRDMIDPQDAINKRQSKFLHLMSVRQTFGNELAMGSMTVRQLREQAARPDGHFSLGSNVEFNKHFGIVPTSDMAEGQFTLLQQAIAEMDLQGPNAAMQGKDPRNQSGRAILAQQQGGALEANPTFDTLRHMDNECYKKCWRRIRQGWKAEDYIRVTDDERNIKWISINTPKMDRVTGPDGNPMLDPSTGRAMTRPMINPQTGQPVMQNEMSNLDVDIIMDEAPHVGTIQQEELQMLVEMAKAGLPIPPKTIIKNTQLRSKYDILKDIEVAEQKAAQQPSPEMQKAQADAQAKQAELQGKLAMQQQQAQLQQAEMEAELQMQMIESQQQMEMKRQQHEQELSFEWAKHQQSMQMEREKMQLKANLELEQTWQAGQLRSQEHAQDMDLAREASTAQLAQAERMNESNIAQKEAMSRAAIASRK